ncbi:hypothetical protein WS68_06430 [Burkholderia sp. TSV86]|nr:hypothetical protein WS68_06430 [Burkholderia sp. TSV86]
MKHADATALDRLEDLLVELRALPGLKERSRGVFYLRGKPFLHFHVDPQGLFADLRRDSGFDRFAVDTAANRGKFLRAVHVVSEARPSSSL